jgi:hypothetical protein
MDTPARLALTLPVADVAVGDWLRLPVAGWRAVLDVYRAGDTVYTVVNCRGVVERETYAWAANREAPVLRPNPRHLVAKDAEHTG